MKIVVEKNHVYLNFQSPDSISKQQAFSFLKSILLVRYLAGLSSKIRLFFSSSLAFVCYSLPIFM